MIFLLIKQVSAQTHARNSMREYSSNNLNGMKIQKSIGCQVINNDQEELMY